MQVFQRIHDRLLASGDVVPAQVHTPEGDGFLPTDDDLSLVHTREYLAALSSPEGLDPARTRRIGFGADAFSGDDEKDDQARRPLLLRRTRAEVAGTLLTARLALKHGLAVCTAGGTHHARADSGAGFCVINDLAYAAAKLVSEGAAGKVAVVDLDVHQGDGTASIFSTSADNDVDSSPVPRWIRQERVFTLSVHAANNFPARKEVSSLDVPLPDGCGDGEFLSAVADALERVLLWLEEPLVLTSADQPQKPLHPALVLYDAGVDVHQKDALGRLSVSDGGLRRRDALVLDTFLAAGVPVAGFVGGGYADDLDELAERHMHLHRAALEMWGMCGLGAEEGRRRLWRAGEEAAAVVSTATASAAAA
jgi:acetoin utilization deacetylase AcuC-like enzyme